MKLEEIFQILNNNLGAITTILIVVTACYVYLVYLTLVEMQKSRKIASIEKILEKLCYPFLYTIKTFRDHLHSINSEVAKIGENKMKEDVCQEDHQDTFKIWQIIIEKYFYFRQDLEKIIPFLHLDAKIEEMFNRPIEGIDDALYVKDFKDWKNLDGQQKCKEINEIRSKVDFSNFKNKMVTLDSIILKISEIVKSLKDDRKNYIR